MPLLTEAFRIHEVLEQVLVRNIGALILRIGFGGILTLMVIPELYSNSYGLYMNLLRDR